METTDRRKERSKNAISLENFGQRKGQVRALEEFRNRKERKRKETAIALRKYKKTMKSEGYEAGTGAGRKRRTEEEEQDEKKFDDKKVPHKRQKTNPFQKSIDKARQKKEEIQERIKSKEKNEKERERKLRERKRQSKLLAKRTKRGQPIMIHTVDNILKKLEKGI
mmetsp:Transcript_55085/g.159510  ORF Transcript_55085/g.159510 Transcript_55085/m.159510 type:complete len:166 (+) Transcript_55085:139-636(+)